MSKKRAQRSQDVPGVRDACAAGDTSATNDATSDGDARAAKRAQFEAASRRSPITWIAPLAMLGIVIVVAVVLVTARGGDKAAPAAAAPVTAQTPAASGGTSVPVADVSDGQVHFYSASVDGKAVRYFLATDGSGKVRAAFDACDVCYPAKKGYTQQGGVVVCNNCGRQFPIEQIGVQEGGCNPSPLDVKVKGGKVVITQASLAQGGQYF